MRAIQAVIGPLAFYVFSAANLAAQSLYAQAKLPAERTSNTRQAEERGKLLERLLGREVKIGVGSFRLKLTFEEAVKNAEQPYYSPSQFILGLHYYQRGDFTNAFKWFEKAATNDDANAQYALSVLYEKGEGVTKDKDRSGRWLLKASREPSHDAAFALGLESLKDSSKDGADPNALSSAAMYFELAAAFGDIKGQQYLRRVFPQLNNVEAGMLLGEPSGVRDKFRLLEGLGKVWVTANIHLTGLSKEAITEERIVSVAELRLRAAGIDVEQPDAKAGRFLSRFPTLIVILNCLRADSGLVAWHIKVECVHVAQHLYLPFLATIWESDTIGTVGKDNLTSLTTYVERLVDEFANDFLKANPKK